MKTLIRAALLALAFCGLATAQAGAATIPPGLLVVNGLSSKLTTYPLSASGDAKPDATVAADSTPSLHNPEGVALDGAGDSWVANVGANTLVEYSQAQLAAGGTPTPIATITAVNGSLDLPTGVAFDPAGDLWVTNSGSNTLVKYTPGQIAAGGAQTPAVTLTSDGSGSLDTPYYPAFDAAGNLWVPDFGTNTLVEFTPSQLTASGSPTPATTISTDSANDLNQPTSITFDAAGDLWTASNGSSRVLEYTPAQLVSGGDPTPVKAFAAPFPTQARFDASGDLWVSESLANAVVEFTAAQVAAGGSPTPAGMIDGNDTGLSEPTNLVVEQGPSVSSVSVNGGPVGTSVPISGTGFYPGSTVRFGDTVASVKYVSPYQLTALAPSGTGTVDVTVTTAFGSAATSPGDRFTYSDAPTVPPSLVVGNDASASTLTSFPLSANGNVAPASTLSDDGSGVFAYPIDGALDASGDLWAPSFRGADVVEYTKRQLIDGGPQAPAVRITADSAGSLSLPSGAAFDASGNLWVTDDNDTVLEYTKAQLATGGAQVPAITLRSDSSSSIAGPDGLGFDSSGNLWVANFDQNTVVEFAKAQLGADGAPTPAVTLSSDDAESLSEPDALTFDRHGDLWVTNGEDGNTVVEYTPNQFVTGAPAPLVTISSDAAGSLNGSDQAQFDAAGDLWVADFEPLGNSGSVVEFTPSQLASSGSPTPVDTIGGDATGLSNPWVLLIEQAPTVSGVSPGSGPAAGGTSVTISGSGFYPGSSVEFGGVAAGSVTYVTPYELTAVAPAGSGTVDVTVSTGEGTSTTSPADQFAYAAAPVPVTTPTGPVATGSAPVLVPRVGSAARQVRVTGRLAAVTLTCSVAACSGTARLTERVTVSVREGKRTVRRQKTVVLGTVRYSIKAGHRATVKLRLSAAALAALAHAKQHRLNAGLTVTVAGGQPLNKSVVLLMVVKPGQTRM